MCNRQSKGVISDSLLQKLELKVTQSKEPNSDFCIGQSGWCPCLLRTPPPNASMVMDDQLKQERHDKRGDVFIEEIKCNECSFSNATACPKIVTNKYHLYIIMTSKRSHMNRDSSVCTGLWAVCAWFKMLSLKHSKQDHEGDENSKAGIKVLLERNDCFSFTTQQDSLL